MNAEELRACLHREIPLSRSMGVRVLEPGPGRVTLEAPLEPNTNHRATAFGGSVSTLATLAGWSLVHGRLRAGRHEAHVVIQRGSTDYLRPITSSFQATCDDVGPDAWDRLLRTMHRSGMGRIHVAVDVTAEDRVVARFEGAYVALTP